VAVRVKNAGAEVGVRGQVVKVIVAVMVRAAWLRMLSLALAHTLGDDQKAAGRGGGPAESTASEVL